MKESAPNIPKGIRIAIVAIWILVAGAFLMRNAGLEALSGLRGKTSLAIGLHIPIAIAVGISAFKLIAQSLNTKKYISESAFKKLDHGLDLVGRVVIHFALASVLFFVLLDHLWRIGS